MPTTGRPEPESPPPSRTSESEDVTVLARRLASLEERIRALEAAHEAGDALENSQAPDELPPSSRLDLEARLAGSFLNYTGLLALLLGLALLIGYWLESHAVLAVLLAVFLLLLSYLFQTRRR